jgi:parallel beta-helix repeat protein
VSCTKVAAPSGSDSAAGTEAAPYRSVQRLADSLSAGQTGCLRGGTYEGNVSVRRGGAPGAPITLTRFPGETAKVVGRVWVAKGADHVTFERLYLDGTNASNLPSPTVNANNVTFRLNDVTNNHTAICFLLGASDKDNDASYGRAGSPLIEANKIHNCGKLPRNNHEHGIYVEGSDGARITGNWIYDNADYGLHLYPDAQGSVATGNVIDGNGGGVIFGSEGGTTPKGNLVENNVVTNSKERPNVESWWGGPVGIGNTFALSCAKGGPRDTGNGGVETQDGGFTVAGIKVADPAYANRGAKDFRLQSGSPCASLLGNTILPGPDGGGAAGAAKPPPASSKPRKKGVRRVKLTVASRASRAGRSAGTRRVALSGRVTGDARSGRRVRIQVRTRRGWKTIRTTRVLGGGSFRASVRRGDRMTLRAVVTGVGRSNLVRA